MVTRWSQVLACLCLVLMANATKPTIYEDGWSPVHASQVVELPKQVNSQKNEGIPVARPAGPVPLQVAPRVAPQVAPAATIEVESRVENEQEAEVLNPESRGVPVEEEAVPQDGANDRIDIVHERVSSVDGPSGNQNFVSQQIQEFQEEEVEEEEGETAAPPVAHKPKPEVDETPLIIYPSGTVPNYVGPNDDGNRYSSQEPVEEEEEPPLNGPTYAQGSEDHPLRPGPPQFNRYQPPPPRPQLLPRRPPPPQPNWRRPPPPPPPQQQQPGFDEPAYPRTIIGDEVPFEAAAPRQSPFEGPPPQQIRPRPRPENTGVLSSIGSSLSNLGGSIKCAAEDIAADARLQDEAFMQRQLDCVLDKGPCDELGANVKRLAPDIMRGICPHPCNECQKSKIQKVMSTIARKYPRQWNEMVREFGRRHQIRNRDD